MRFQTTGGQFVSAASKAEAAALAAHYGFGEISGAAPAPAKKAGSLRPMGIWDDMTQSWEVGPSADYASMAAAMADRRADGHDSLVSITATGGIAPPTAAERAAFRRATA